MAKRRVGTYLLIWLVGSSGWFSFMYGAFCLYWALAGASSVHERIESVAWAVGMWGWSVAAAHLVPRIARRLQPR